MGTEQIGMEVATVSERAPAHDAEPTSLVQLAIEKGVDVEVIERLVALQERVTERNAELAMHEALTAFQAACPPVPRTRTADVKKNGVKQYEYRFAPLEKIVEVIGPHLRRYGLSYTHDAEVNGSNITVTCTLQHIDGAKRTATFCGPFDNSGGKNPLQAVGSSRSYGRRYTLIDVLGLMTEDDDDGGAAHHAAASAEKITDSQAADLDALIDEVGANRDKFLRFFRLNALTDMPVSRLQEATALLEERRRNP